MRHKAARRGPTRDLGYAVALGLLALLGGTPFAPFAPTPSWAQSASRGEAAYRLGPGDRVRLSVFGHKDLSGEFELDGEGRVSLPLIGAVSLLSLSLADAEREIAERLKPDYLKNPQVSLEVLNYRPFYIIGEVRNPGSYPYVNGINVLNAVAIAGGFTYRAREETVYLRRATEPEDQKRLVGVDTTLLPGDFVEVRERFF